MTFGRAALVAASLAAFGGCAVKDTVAMLATGAAQTDRSTYCQGTGPPVLADGTCTGVLTQRYFGRAACTCGLLSPGGDLVTDAFDSRTGAPGPGGDVAADGGLAFGGLMQVGGNLTVSGGGLQAGTTLLVARNLDVGGSLGRPGSAVNVGGSARVGGNVDVGALVVAGTLTTPPGALLSGAISGPGRTTAPVSVPPSCACGAGEALDVAAIVAQHRVANHNASIGLDPGIFASLTADGALDLECGRFYLDRIVSTGAAGVRLRATGRTALFVGGDITVGGTLTIEVAPGAELDLFVAGPTNLQSAFVIGDTTRPAALRLWLAQGGAFTVPPGSRLAAAVYAPGADLASGGNLDLFGSAVVRQLAVNAPLRIHHDLALAAAAVACAP